MNTTHFSILEKLGLSSSEALIFELLLENGRQKVRDLVEKSCLGRGNVYHILESLEVKKLILSIQGGKKIEYQVQDPSHLGQLLSQKERDLTHLQSEFGISLGQMASLFNMSVGKPSIEIFEGLDGIKRALEDTLTTKEEILTFVDLDMITGEIDAIDRQYVKKREKMGIKKRLILPNNEVGRTLYKQASTEYTTIKLVNQFPSGYNASIQIYATCVLFLLITKGKEISLIIRDPSICAFHRSIFEFFWQQAQIPNEV